jgi:hypothetical protein
MIQKRKKKTTKKNNHIKSKKYIVLFLNAFLFFSCSTQQKIKTKVIVLTDSIQTPYAYLNEIKVISKNKTISTNIVKIIQQISENKIIQTSNPEKRLILKKKLFKECFNSDMTKCKYIPEKYKILSNKNEILNIEYSYNSFGSHDEWYKYACFNLKTVERITHDKMFKDSNEILKKYNEKYVQRINNYIKNNRQKTEEDKEEYDIYKEHLETRNSFKLTDLNNVEFIYTGNKIESIRFHYNGMSGVYNQLFPNDYIEFSTKELRPFLKDFFN